MFKTRKNAYKKIAIKGIVDMLPLNLSVIPWGILCGSLAVTRGFSFLEALFMPIFVFAGAVQLVVIELISTNTPLLSILFTAFTISSRHFLYALTIRKKISCLNVKYRLLFGFLLTDEFFALSHHRKSFKGKLRIVYSIFAGASFYLGWITWNLIGILLGNYLPDLTNYGLDFAIAVTFIAIVIPSVKSLPMLVAILTSGFFSVILKSYQFELSLVCSSIIGMGSGYITFLICTKKSLLKLEYNS